MFTAKKFLRCFICATSPLMCCISYLSAIQSLLLGEALCAGRYRLIKHHWMARTCNRLKAFPGRLARAPASKSRQRHFNYCNFQWLMCWHLIACLSRANVKWKTAASDADSMVTLETSVALSHVCCRRKSAFSMGDTWWSLMKWFKEFHSELNCTISRSTASQFWSSDTQHAKLLHRNLL